MVNPQEAIRSIAEIQQKRAKINFTGREDINLLDQIKMIKNEATREINEINAQLRVCPNSMVSGLIAKRDELEEVLRVY